MPPIVRIAHIGHHVGETVTLHGWVYNRTDKGRLQFIQVRDGSGVIQAVAFKKNLAEDTFEAARHVTQESSVIVTGTVREDPRSPSGYEMDVTDFVVVQTAQDYPISPKEHGVGFLMENRHLWLRSARQTAIIRAIRN